MQTKKFMPLKLGWANKTVLITYSQRNLHELAHCLKAIGTGSLCICSLCISPMNKWKTETVLSRAESGQSMGWVQRH